MQPWSLRYPSSPARVASVPRQPGPPRAPLHRVHRNGALAVKWSAIDRRMRRFPGTFDEARSRTHHPARALPRPVWPTAPKHRRRHGHPASRRTTCELARGVEWALEHLRPREEAPQALIKLIPGPDPTGATILGHKGIEDAAPAAAPRAAPSSTSKSRAASASSSPAAAGQPRQPWPTRSPSSLPTGDQRHRRHPR